MDCTVCVVFDIDDTLYLERDYVLSGFRATGSWLQEHAGVTGFFERAWGAFQDGARGTIFNRVLSDLGVEDSPALIAGLVEVYREHQPEIELTPDARLCLDELLGRVLLGVITDGPVVSQRAKAGALGLEGWLPEMIFTGELGPNLSKPHPRAFELMQGRTASAGSRCVYVADNPVKDFSGPKQLGWRTVRIRRAGALHQEIESGSDVDLELSDLARLPQLVTDQGASSEGNEVLC